MVENLSVFSLLFLFAILIYIYWGVYIIRLNSKSNTNKMFLFICISLSIWSFGFAMSNSAINEETALFWQRFSSIGWTTTYSIVLHFLLLLSHKGSSLKQRRLFRLLHLPALISMYVFTISNKIAPVQYNLLKTDYGWINKLTNNGWDTFFNIYYISYMLLSIVVVWRWRQSLEDKKTAKRAGLIVKALLFSSIVGTFTDRVASSILDTSLPQMAPLFILLPTWAMYHSARYYDVLRKEKVHVNDIIVTEEDKKNIFNNLSIVFYLAAIFSFIAEYIPNINDEDSLKFSLLKSMTLLGFGISIKIIQTIKKESIKESLTIALLVFSIPIASMQYLNYASITVWAFPMVIIISSVIFSKRILLISTVAASIITQGLIWVLRPEITVVVDKYDYILRISMIIVAFLIASFINKIYVSKIKENKDQIKLQKINLELSFDFADINQENFDEKVNIMLSKLGGFFGVDRTYLYLLNHENNTMMLSHRWCNEKDPIEIDANSDVHLEFSSSLEDQLKANRIIYVEDISKISDELMWERDILMQKKIKSLVIAPVEDNGLIQGFIGIDARTSFESWSEQKMEFINIVSNLLSSGINKIESEKEINFMAYYDYLTKLPNRFLFEDRVNRAIKSAKENDEILSVIFIDLDNFKVINDTMGHSSGDYLLKKVGDSLSEIFQEKGIVSRSGGDEFMIMLNNIKDQSELLNEAESLINLFSKPFNINGRDFLITTSAGVAIYPIDGEDSETLVKNADIAMYEAKDIGKNQYVLCTDTIKQEVQMNMSLSNDMYQALERDEFVIHYQPQVDLSTGEINGLEALLRWEHPEKGMISPGIFIPLAEKNGMINSIGEWVLRTACLQNKKWQEMDLGNLCMAVNLSSVQFVDANIAENVEAIIKETGLDPKYLELEITESIAIKQETHAEEVLKKLKKIGISIAIDDFGTEYSSLSRLKILPIDRIKIDMQFTQGIEKSEKDRSIIMVIINLAKRLGMSVIAEGAETAEQVDFLYKESCDDVQGYYYYKPMPADEIEELLYSAEAIKNASYSVIN